MSRLGITAKLDNQKHVVNVNPVNNINVNVRSPSDVQEGVDADISANQLQAPVPQDGTVHYDNPYMGINDVASGVYITPTDNNVQRMCNDMLQLMNENAALKIVINMFKRNPVYVNHLLLVDDKQLSELIKLLTNADEVLIDCEDIGAGCTCGAQEYRKVNAIYVKKGNNTQNLKYDYPAITKELKDIGINTKVVW